MTDDEKLIDRVERFLEVCDLYCMGRQDYGERPDEIPGGENMEADLLTALPAVVRIAEVRYPQVKQGIEVNGNRRDWDVIRTYVRQLLGVLQDGATLEEELGPSGPTLTASAFHPVVWDAAKHRWDRGRPLDAIRGATAEVEQQLRDKVDIHDGDVTHIVGEVFKADEPRPREKRLRFTSTAPGSNDWKSMHAGAASFGRGIFQAIRNPHTHSNDEPDRQVALEYLASLSVLARWIDEAAVETAPSPDDQLRDRGT